MPEFIASPAEFVRRIYVLARPYGRRRLALVTGMSVIQGMFQVLGVTSIFPFLALASDPNRLRNSNLGRRLLEYLPPMDNNQLLLFAGVFAIGTLVLSNAVNLGAEFHRNRYAYGFTHWLRVGLLRKIVMRPYGDFLKLNTAILMKKVTGDVVNYTSGVLLPLLDSIARVATIFFLIAGLIAVHPQIAIGATVVLGGFYAVVFRYFSGWRKRATDDIKKTTTGMVVDCRKLLDGIKPVKVHRAEEVFLGRFAAHSLKQSKLMSWIPILTTAPRYVIEPLAFGGLVLIVLIYVAQGQDFSTILPNLGVIALAGFRILPALQLLYGDLNSITTKQHALDEVYDEILAFERSVGKDTDSTKGVLSRPARLKWNQEIRLENVDFNYPGAKRPVIENLSLSIPRNSSLGIMGETGSGKSTLVDLILGLHLPTSGRIFVDTTVLGTDNRRAWQGGIGYVPQDIFLIDDTVTANVAFGVPAADIDNTRVREATAAAQLLKFIEEDLPLGFNTVVGERGVRLSGGQRQRIGLARALYHRPELLILDEATSALDNETEAEVMNAVNSLQGNVTMIIIAHRLSTLKNCNSLLDLNRTPESMVAGGA